MTAGDDSQTERKLRRLRRMYALIHQTRSAIRQVESRQQLLDTVCRLAVDTRGVRAAWIGVVDQREPQVRVVAHAGPVEAYLAQASILGDLSCAGSGPFGRAVRDRRTVVCNDTQSDPGFEPLRDLVRDCGFGSAAVVPLGRRHGPIWGGFVQYAESDFFDEEEIVLLDQIGDEISVAVEAMEAEAGRRQTEQALRESQERFRAVFEGAGVGLCEVGHDHRFLQVNERLCEILGYTQQELLEQRDCVETTHPDDRAADKAAIERLCAGEPKATLLKRFLRKGGQPVWSQMTLSMLRSTDAEAQDRHHFVAIIEDVTLRKQAEDERDRLFDASVDLLSMTRFDGFLENVNAAWTRCLGWTKEELVGRRWTDLLHPDDVELSSARVRSILTGNSVVEFESRHRCKDGSYRWLTWNAHPLTESRQIFSIARDVTERRHAERRLAEQAALLDKAQDAILVRDLSHNVLYWNKSAERLYGWSAAEALCRPVTALLGETSAFDVAMAVLEKRGEWVGELEHRTKDGQTVTVEAHWTLVRDDRGEPKSVLAIDTDITEKKRLEAQFLRAQRMESIGTLASGIAHDMNNLLTPILMSVSALRDCAPGLVANEALQTIECCAQRGADTIRQLMTFARGAEGLRAPVDLAIIAGEVERMVRDSFPKSVVFDHAIAPGLRHVQADATQMHQLMTNLCVNARDAMPSGGTLLVTLASVDVDETAARMDRQARPGPYVRLTVEDTGSGMTPETLDRIFDPFYTTKAVGKGTGLGLSIVHNIVHNHRGFIRVDSESGKGTRFQVFLPADSAPLTGERPAVPSPMVPRGSGELVLLVDDEENILKMTRRTLERSGYRVLVAPNGAMAVALYAQHQRDVAVVLTDMRMPVMDGPATVVALRTISPDLRIIGSSGLDDTDDLGLSAFIAKPYTAEAVLNVIHRVLQREP